MCLCCAVISRVAATLTCSAGKPKAKFYQKAKSHKYLGVTGQKLLYWSRSPTTTMKSVAVLSVSSPASFWYPFTLFIPSSPLLLHSISPRVWRCWWALAKDGLIPACRALRELSQVAVDGPLFTAGGQLHGLSSLRSQKCSHTTAPPQHCCLCIIASHCLQQMGHEC